VNFRKIGKTIYCVIAYFFYFYKTAIVRCENRGRNKKISEQKIMDFNKKDLSQAFLMSYIAIKNKRYD